LSSRAEVVAQLSDLMRRSSTYALFIHQAIAERLGLGMTDLKCLDAAHQEPQLTPSRLAEISGLSTSATTAVLDRLEKRGFVTRVRDEQDRRRVFIAATGRHEAEVSALFEPLGTAAAAILEHYDDDQLALITGFFERLNAMNEELISSKALIWKNR